MLNVILVSTVMLNVILVSTVMLNVILVSIRHAKCHLYDCHYYECHFDECLYTDQNESIGVFFSEPKIFTTW
jgi:hypothetical protein